MGRAVLLVAEKAVHVVAFVVEIVGAAISLAGSGCLAVAVMDVAFVAVMDSYLLPNSAKQD